MAKVGGIGSGQGKVRKQTKGVMIRCQVEKDGFRCVKHMELVLPKGSSTNLSTFEYRCQTNGCPHVPKSARLGQQKQKKH